MAGHQKKIAFIVQRFGADINGGAELHCRLIAGRLSAIYDVEILTSCAKNHITWFDEYEPGISVINNLKVRRFATGNPQSRKKLRLISRKLNKNRTYQKLLSSLGLLNVYEKLLPSVITAEDYEKWVTYQGPYLPDLIRYLKQNESQYDALIFFTYLYYPTIEGLKVAPEKSILVPTAHDEPPIYYPIFKQIFNSPKALLYNTLSEKRFVNRLFDNGNIYSDIAGVGIDIVEPAASIHVSKIVGFNDDYLVYIGRVDALKGCVMLCDYLLRYNATVEKPVKLVLVGQLTMQVPVNENIVALGFVADDVKNALLKNAKALVMPSFYESLSLITLESMAYGTPVIANKNCKVLKDHIDSSHAGFLFADIDDFSYAVNALFNPETDLAGMRKNGKAYIAKNYTWPATLEKYMEAIEYVSSGV